MGKRSRFRVVFTDGTLKLNVLWGKHKGTDFYFGFSHEAGNHWSYHESGEFHRVQDGKYLNKAFFTPTAEIIDHSGVFTAACRNFSDLLSNEGKPVTSDAQNNTLLVDIRNFPEGVILNLVIGLFREKGLPFVNQVAHSVLPGQVGPTQVLWSKTFDPNAFIIVKGFKNVFEQ